MSVDELRAGLARIAGTVVPDPDPYTLVLRHARRRRRRRFAGLVAAVAALLAAALTAPVALTAADRHDRADDLPLGHGHPVDSPWGWRLLDSPTRGSLAGDKAFLAEVVRLFDRRRAELRMAADLPTVKVLFADDSAGVRQVVVAYRSATAAALVSREGPVGASPVRLLGGDGMSNGRADPFSLLTAVAGTVGDQRQWLLGLAPAGCRISLGRAAYAGQSTLRRTWQLVNTDGYVLLEQDVAGGWWRVECDGRIRHEGPIWVADTEGRGNADGSYPTDGRWAPAADPPNPTVARQAGRVYRALAGQAGLIDAGPVIRWSGRLDAAGGEAVLLAAVARVGPTLLQVGGTGAAPLVADATARDPAPTDTVPAPEPLRSPLVSTGYGPAYDLVAARVPVRDGERAVLGGQLLVVPRKGVVRVEAVVDGTVRASAPVTGGAALLTLPVGSTVTLRGLDRDGVVRCSGPLREPAAGERLFNEPLVSAW